MRGVFPFPAPCLTQLHTTGTKRAHTRGIWLRTVGSIPIRRNPMRRPVLRSRPGGPAGIPVAVIEGMGLASVAGAGPTVAATPPFVDATHVPPVLTVRG